MNDTKQIGASIKRHREAKGVSLRETARGLGTYPSNMHRYEHGLVTPSLPLLWALADYFHVSLDSLVGRDDAPTVDAVPVRHGAWCCVRKSPEEWKCSRCSAYMPSRKNWMEPLPNYCSNCGADMRTTESITHNMPEDMRDKFRESYSGQRL